MTREEDWIPAFAGMTFILIPGFPISASAGMTEWDKAKKKAQPNQVGPFLYKV